MAQIVTAKFVGMTSCGFVAGKYYEIEVSAGRSGCLCVRDMSLALMPDTALTGTGIDATYGGDYFYFNNGADERCPSRGGFWGHGGNAGVFGLHLRDPRSLTNWYVGGRCAFVKQ